VIPWGVTIPPQTPTETGPAGSAPMVPLNGILLIDKPLRRTSMDVCANIRARFRRGGAPKRLKVGHAGTLDPLATGLLVVMVGRATSLCELLMAETKEYLTTVDLSCVSATDDAEGAREEVACATPPELKTVLDAAAKFVGVIQQRPPAYSAIKVAGQRAYDMARRGEVVELPARPVIIHSMVVESYDWPHVTLRVVCGKGTYIRSLARDLGASMGVGGMLTMLRRTASGDKRVDDAVRLESLPDVMTQKDLLPPPPRPNAAANPAGSGEADAESDGLEAGDEA
jgi:tRNA pseudouridine55 synthase